MTKRPQWFRRHRDEIGLALLIALLATFVFVFFKTFFDTRPDDLTIEILAALLGSIVTRSPLRNTRRASCRRSPSNCRFRRRIRDEAP